MADAEERKSINPMEEPGRVDWNVMEGACWEAVANADIQIRNAKALNNADAHLGLLFERAKCIGAAAQCRVLANMQRMTGWKQAPSRLEEIGS